MSAFYSYTALECVTFNSQGAHACFHVDERYFYITHVWTNQGLLESASSFKWGSRAKDRCMLSYDVICMISCNLLALQIQVVQLS